MTTVGRIKLNRNCLRSPVRDSIDSIISSGVVVTASLISNRSGCFVARMVADHASQFVWFYWPCDRATALINYRAARYCLVSTMDSPLAADAAPDCSSQVSLSIMAFRSR